MRNDLRGIAWVCNESTISNKGLTCDYGEWRAQRHMVFLISVVVLAVSLVSCSKKAGQKVFEETTHETIPAPRVTVLADLPDSLEPQQLDRRELQKPLTRTIKVPKPIEVFTDSLSGRSVPAEAQGTMFLHNYTSEDGLSTDLTYKCYEDRDGNLWIATTGGGVSRFDGHSFVTFTTAQGLVDNYVWSMTQDRYGNLWFATFGGLSKYDGRTFTNYTTEQGLPYNDIGSVVEDNAGNMWFGTIDGSLIKFDSTTFTVFGKNEGFVCTGVACITKDKSGRLWIGTRNGGVYTYTYNKSEVSGTLTRVQELPNWNNTTVRRIVQDSSGHMWFGTRSGLFSFNGGDLIQYGPEQGLYDDCVIDLNVDQDGNVWIAHCDGIAKFNGTSFVNFTSRNGLPDTDINDLFFDHAGNMWITTTGSGIFIYRGSSFVMFTRHLNGAINSGVEHDGTLLFSSNDGGLLQYNGTSITALRASDGLADDVVNHLSVDKANNYWVPTYGGGVSYIDHGGNGFNPDGTLSITNYTMQQGLPHNTLYSCLEDSHGNVWFATYGGGLGRMRGDTMTTFTTGQGLISNEIHNIFEDSNGYLWFTSVGYEGMSLFDGVSFTNFTTDQGLISNYVECVYQDRADNLWFGTGEGLNLLKPSTLAEYLSIRPVSIDAPLFEVFTTTNGLPHNRISRILEENDDLILATGAGIAILHGGVNAFNQTDSIEVYGTQTGYPVKEAGLFCKDSNDVLWVPTSSLKSGLVRFDRNALRRDAMQPKIVIQTVKINNTLISWHALLRSLDKNHVHDSILDKAIATEEMTTFGRRLSSEVITKMISDCNGIALNGVTAGYPIPTDLVLPYKSNNISFEYRAIVTDRNQLVRYQYMLNGFNQDWSPLSSETSVSFGNLQEGSYTLNVKAQSPDGIWSQTVSYPFKVLPPWYRTWWAYGSYMLLFIGVLYAVWIYQKNRIQRIERERAKQKQVILNERLRISRELHDEVGATLSGIAMYSHLAKEQIEHTDLPNVKHSLNIMQESSGEMVNKLSDIVWLLNPEQGDLQKLMEKLEDYAGQMGQIKSMRVHTSIPENLSRIELPVEQRKHIYLICKEAINNAVKYSNATKLDLMVRDVDHTLEFIVQDNGVGFDMESVKKGNGLDNMQKRAEEMGARLLIESGLNRGTTLRIQYQST